MADRRPVGFGRREDPGSTAPPGAPTPGGAARLTGPLTSTTLAPASRAASATAYPIFPELRLVMKRTGSMRSRVGPAVTSTLRPASAPAVTADAARDGTAASAQAAQTAAGTRQLAEMGWRFAQQA